MKQLKRKLRLMIVPTLIAISFIMIGVLMRYNAMTGLAKQNSVLEHFIGGIGVSIAISLIVFLCLLSESKPPLFKFSWLINLNCWFDRIEVYFVQSIGPVIYLVGAIFWETTQAFNNVYGNLPRGYIQYDQLGADAISALVAYSILQICFLDYKNQQYKKRI